VADGGGSGVPLAALSHQENWCKPPQMLATSPPLLDVPPLPWFAALWNSSANRKQKERQAAAAAAARSSDAEKGAGAAPHLQQAPSDRGFLLNLMPSFKR